MVSRGGVEVKGARDSDRRSTIDSRLLAGIFAILLIPTTPQAAYAHLVTTGLGPFFDGITHLTVTPEDLLPTLAIAMLVGLRGGAHARLVLFLLPAVWFVAGLVGLQRPADIPFAVTLVSFLLFGGLVAGDIKFSTKFAVIFALGLGGLHGYLNGYEMAVAGLGSVGLVGATASVFVLVALTSAFVVSLEANWSRIAVRVAGSWVVAVGVLMIGWTFRS